MMQEEMLMALLAASPLGLVVILMLFFRWPAARAGGAGLLLALMLAVGVFGYGDRVYPDVRVAGAIGGAGLEAIFTTVTILWIIGPALCLYNLQKITGGIDVLCDGLGKLSTDRRLTALLVAWFFALFMEGAAGFGTPIALAAPFLVSAGFKPVEAVVLALIGHAAGVSFGAVGTPIIPQVQATGLTGLELARGTGIYHSLLGWVMLAILLYLINKSTQRDGEKRGLAIWVWGAFAAVSFLVPFFLISRFVGPELPTLGGAFIGGAVFIGALLLVRRGPVKPIEATNGKKTDQVSLWRGAGPYLTVIALVLMTRLIPSVRDFTFSIEWSWRFAEAFQGTFRPLFHPGTLLTLTFISAIFWLGATRRQVYDSLARTARQLAPVTIALAAMLGLARIMVHSGMIELTAVTLAGAAGMSWPLFAPFVGALGTFVTGSATASNILFTDFQQAAAEKVNLPVTAMVGAQGFGAAVGNIVCPHNIIAGGATVGLKGEEGKVLQKTLPACLIYAALGGIVAFLLTN